MHRYLALMTLVAVPALATGERVIIQPGNPLHEQLCLSMECVTGGVADAQVTQRAVKGGVEVVVTVGGARRLTHTLHCEDGACPSTELARANALVVNAIENPRATPRAEPRTPAKAKKKATVRAALKRRSRVVARR